MPASASDTVYLDSSALVKLVVVEPESDALERYLDAGPSLVSCDLARVEVVRAARLHRPDDPEIEAQAETLLARLELVQLDAELLYAAGNARPNELRSLDTIHLAAAQSIPVDLDVIVTYDRCLRSAAELHRLPVESPT